MHQVIFFIFAHLNGQVFVVFWYVPPYLLQVKAKNMPIYYSKSLGGSLG